MFFDGKLFVTDYKVIKLVFIGDLSTASDHGSTGNSRKILLNGHIHSLR